VAAMLNSLKASKEFLCLLLEVANMRVPRHSGFDGLAVSG
jgi:hypothetical protein